MGGGKRHGPAPAAPLRLGEDSRQVLLQFGDPVLPVHTAIILEDRDPLKFSVVPGFSDHIPVILADKICITELQPPPQVIRSRLANCASEMVS